MLDRLQRWSLLRGFHKTRDEFYELLAKGITNRESLRTFLEAELKISRDPRTADRSRAFALEEMLKAVQVGESASLGAILARVAPKIDHIMLSALDSAKSKPDTLRELALAVREQRHGAAVLRKSMVPLVVLSPSICAMTYVIAFKAIPAASKMAGPEVWTPFNAAVRAFAQFLVTFGGPLVLAAIAAVILFLWHLPTYTHPLRYRFEQTAPKRAKLLFPIAPWILPLSIYRDYQAGMVVKALYVLLSSGATITDAISSLMRDASPWMRVHLKRMLRTMEEGDGNFVTAFSHGLMAPHALARMASNVRTTKNFEDVLQKLGTEGVAEIRREMEASARVMNWWFMGSAAAMMVFLYAGNVTIPLAVSDSLESGGRIHQRQQN